MSLPGGGTWTYSYYGTYSTLPKDDPSSCSSTLKRIADDQNRVVDYSISSDGRLVEVWSNQSFDGGGSLVSYQKTRSTYCNYPIYGSGAWLSEIKNSWKWLQNPGGWQERVLVQNDYTYSDTGNRLTNAISDQNGLVRTEQYGYDELSRLTSVNYGDNQTQGYSFDPMGNRLSKSDSVAGNETYLYDAANRLTNRGGQAYSNDANGNTLSGGGRTNSWDSENRLTQCVYNGTTSSFVYGADGLRRRATVAGVSTDYVLDGQNAVRTLVSGAADKTWLVGLRGPEYERTGAGAAVWNLFDGLGSVTGTVDNSGNIISARKYDVYGSVRQLTGTSGTKHKFCGGLGHPSEDETGLVYMRARYMDPVTGRFVSEDPGRHGANWFAYATANPTSRLDRTGKEDELSGEALDELLHEATRAALRGEWDKVAEILERISGPIRRLPTGREGVPADDPGGTGSEVSPGDDVMKTMVLVAVTLVLALATIIAAGKWGGGICIRELQIRSEALGYM
jgi:RHS repeat-associated protein